MGRLILGLTALLLLAGTATPVLACINDREVNRSEREFKSQYLQPTPANQPSSQPSQNPLISFAYISGGAILLIGATVTAFKKVRRRATPE